YDSAKWLQDSGSRKQNVQKIISCRKYSSSFYRKRLTKRHLRNINCGFWLGHSVVVAICPCFPGPIFYRLPAALFSFFLGGMYEQTVSTGGNHLTLSIRIRAVRVGAKRNYFRNSYGQHGGSNSCRSSDHPRRAHRR